MHTMDELRERQALPLKLKIAMTKTRIREWINHYGKDGVYVSFSGGKDSTVLLDIARQDYPDIKAMFVDVPTQYPELRQFVKTFDNVDIIRPKIGFIEVCKKYGFPFFGKEIADCISSSRSYMKKVRENKNQLTYYAGAYAIADILGVERRKKGSNLEIYENLKKGILPVEKMPVRMQQMLGKVKNKDDYSGDNDYSKMYDKSQYAFMLDAPFECSPNCCKIMKKEPAHRYSKETGRVAMTAQMAEESRLRATVWLKNGCNSFDAKNPISNPMSFWTEQDVLQYIKERNLPICSVYGDIVSDDEEMGQMQLSDYAGYEMYDIGKQPLHCTGCKRTGCILCGFGAHIPGDDRFVKLKETHPGMYGLLDKIENNGYTMRQAIDWIAEHSDKVIKY